MNEELKEKPSPGAELPDNPRLPWICKQRPAGDWVVDQLDREIMRVRRFGPYATEQDARAVWFALNNTGADSQIVTADYACGRGAGMSAHRKCPVLGCQMAVAGNKFMCPTHWQMVPGAIQKRVYQTFRVAPQSEAHFRAMGQAVDFVNKYSAPHAALPEKEAA